MKIIAADKRRPGFLVNPAVVVSVSLILIFAIQRKNKTLTRVSGIFTSVPETYHFTLVYLHHNRWSGDANGRTRLSIFAPSTRNPSRRRLLVSPSEQQHERSGYLHNGPASLE